MSRCLIALLAATVTLTAACGNEAAPESQTALAPAPDDAVIAQQADATWMNALQAGNAAGAGTGLDADFEWTDASGRTRERADTL